MRLARYEHSGGRDWQPRTQQWTLGKSFDTHGPIVEFLSTVCTLVVRVEIERIGAIENRVIDEPAQPTGAKP